MEKLSDRTIMITGATDGLGKLVARRLAQRNAQLILHGRNPSKGEKIVEEIVRATGNVRIKYYNADLSSLDEVRNLGTEVSGDYQKLDVLINNAGIGAGSRGENRRELSKDGFELRFAVNYLSHFLLTYLLIPVIEKSKAPRIVNVSSIGQQAIDFENLMLEKGYDGFGAYKQSKLAMIMFTFDLAEEVKEKHIAVNCLHPASLMPTKMVYEYFDKVISTLEQGADAVVQLAVGEKTQGISGKYFDGMTPSKAIPQAYDKNAREKLKDISIKLTGIKSRGV